MQYTATAEIIPAAASSTDTAFKTGTCNAIRFYYRACHTEVYSHKNAASGPRVRSLCIVIDPLASGRKAKRPGSAAVSKYPMLPSVYLTTIRLLLLLLLLLLNCLLRGYWRHCRRYFRRWWFWSVLVWKYHRTGALPFCSESCPTADLSNISPSQWSGLYDRWAVEHAPGKSRLSMFINSTLRKRKIFCVKEIS